MPRLTKRDEFGNADIIGVDNADLQLNLGFNEFNMVTTALNKLADYEDDEENGKIFKFPCAVGDTIYRIGYGDTVESYLVQALITDDSGGTYISTIDRFKVRCDVNVRHIGKSWFLTKEEAERHIKNKEKLL